MPNIFDDMQEKAFGVVTKTMGYDAAWKTFSGRVLFNEPTDYKSLGGKGTGDSDIAKYINKTFDMEYFEGVFPGLFEASRVAKAIPEQVTVNGVDYYVRSIERKFDGKNYIAKLERK